MAAIALVGGDGAGKSTIGQMLQRSELLPFKYLYMGINLESSNMMLPTSRLLRYLRRCQTTNTTRPAGPVSKSEKRAGSSAKAVLRLINRLTEEWFRQILSWSYQSRGYIALYDRHYLFDFYKTRNAAHQVPLAERVHLWCLSRLYPKPDLIIFLDAPPAVLVARKCDDKTVEFLESRRAAILELGARTPGFVRVDATQPLEHVYREVLDHIERRRQPEGHRSNPREHREPATL